MRNKIKKKIKSQSGLAILVWILLVAVIIMSGVVFLPSVFGMGSETKASIDRQQEKTAKDSAHLEYMANSSEFDMIYDATNKQFVPMDERATVVPYGEMKEHEGMVIRVQVLAGEQIVVSWIDPVSYGLN